MQILGLSGISYRPTALSLLKGLSKDFAVGMSLELWRALILMPKLRLKYWSDSILQLTYSTQ